MCNYATLQWTSNASVQYQCRKYCPVYAAKWKVKVYWFFTKDADSCGLACGQWTHMCFYTYHNQGTVYSAAFHTYGPENKIPHNNERKSTLSCCIWLNNKRILVFNHSRAKGKCVRGQLQAWADDLRSTFPPCKSAIKVCIFPNHRCKTQWWWWLYPLLSVVVGIAECTWDTVKESEIICSLTCEILAQSQCASFCFGRILPWAPLL